MDDFTSLKPSFVSVTYGAGGSTRQRTHDLVVELQQGGQVDPIPHLTCVQQTTQEIETILSRYAAAGVSKPVLRRFKRELAALRGQGETFA